MAKYGTKGEALVNAGNKYVVKATTAGASISVQAGVRLVAFWSLTGTGSVAFYDNAAGDTTGQQVLALAATVVGAVVRPDIPLTTGLAIVVGSTTSIVVVYHE